MLGPLRSRRMQPSPTRLWWATCLLASVCVALRVSQAVSVLRVCVACCVLFCALTVWCLLEIGALCPQTISLLPVPWQVALLALQVTLLLQVWWCCWGGVSVRCTGAWLIGRAAVAAAATGNVQATNGDVRSGANLHCGGEGKLTGMIESTSTTRAVPGATLDGAITTAGGVAM